MSVTTRVIQKYKVFRCTEHFETWQSAQNLGLSIISVMPTIVEMEQPDYYRHFDFRTGVFVVYTGEEREIVE